MKMLKVMGVLMLGLFVASCSDDENKNKTDKLSSEEQAEIVASTVGQSGFVGASEQSAEQADQATGARLAECGFTDSGSANLSGSIGSIAFSYALVYDVALSCDSNDEPERFESEISYEGSFENPRFESSYAGDGSLTITQLTEADVNYEIDGSYGREGSFQTKVGKEASGSSEIDVEIENVKMRKSDKKVIAGTADLLVKGQVTGKGSYSFDAHVEFHDNGTATIKVNDDTFLMIVATGEVTAK